MLYALFCYDREDVVGAWSLAEDTAVTARLRAVETGLEADGRLAGAARLLPTTTAVTLRRGGEAVIVDGPFAETGEQLLGFYVVDCDGLEAAIATARTLAIANPDGGAYEIRPIGLYRAATASPARGGTKRRIGA